MAQDAVLGHAVAKSAFEDIDVVDALADERAFAEQVLVDIGDGSRIGVDAGLATMQPCVAAAVSAGQTQGNARLQDAVALDHNIALRAAASRLPYKAIWSALKSSARSGSSSVVAVTSVVPARSRSHQTRAYRATVVKERVLRIIGRVDLQGKDKLLGSPCRTIRQAKIRRQR